MCCFTGEGGVEGRSPINSRKDTLIGELTVCKQTKLHRPTPPVMFVVALSMMPLWFVLFFVCCSASAEGREGRRKSSGLFGFGFLFGGGGAREDLEQSSDDEGERRDQGRLSIAKG